MTSIKGKLHLKEETKQISDSFKKRDFVLDVTDNPEYPTYHKFELLQDSVSLIDSLNIGDELDVHYNLGGRAWTNKEGEVKYFNSTRAWKIESVSTSQPTGMPEPQVEKAEVIEDEQDSLPF